MTFLSKSMFQVKNQRFHLAKNIKFEGKRRGVEIGGGRKRGVDESGIKVTQIFTLIIFMCI